MAERRKHERTACLDKVIVRRLASEGEKTEIPIYLRDISPGGMSGTFFGERIPSCDDLLLVDSSPQGPKTARIVWSRNTIGSIHMLGFKFVN
jgi:hypothetical protein